jgi:hypothetical protein
MAPIKNIRPFFTSEDANIEIRNLIEAEKPCMVCRFGSVELNAIVRISQLSKFNTVDLLLENIKEGRKAYSEKAFHDLKYNAGFFPINKSNLKRFYLTMLDSIKEVDLLGSWVSGENYFSDKLSHAQICSLADIEPYYHRNPWTKALQGRKVLVIHPFSESIKNQYLKNRNNLFEDKDILPDFEIITYKAIQTIAGNTENYNNWFDALEKMVSDIKGIDYEIALIGCGAYGFPIAAKIKRDGKKAIHLGGATQILFGIKGSRWDSHPIISKFYNNNWVRPSVEETPENIVIVENASYW